jgi:diazepam-binding inhibitor (GABA receptor modulating acyl-CoA-binding protein)
MELTQEFVKAAEESKSLKDRPSNDTLLQLYSLYKQAKEGDNNSDPPSNPFDFVAKAKYEAWATLRGKSSFSAMEEYIELIKKLKA